MKYEGHAGKVFGKGDDTVVLIGDDNTTRDLQIKGRHLYVKKCLRPENMGGIMLCDKSRSDTVFSLVLAVSAECGRFHKLTKEQKKRGELSSVVMDVKPGMKVVTPDDHPWGIRRSPYGTDEFFIREDIIKFALEE